jgi:hypothetical protein
LRKLEVNVSEELLRRISEAIPEEAVPDLIEAALTEWVGWLDGSFRPMSISELEMRRVFELYDRILVDEAPSAERLGEVLEMPMGRARYMMQNLAYRHGGMLRQRRARAILKALDEGHWSARRDSCAVTIDPGFRELMDRTIRSLAAQGNLESIVSGDLTLEGVRYEMGPNHHEALTEAFREEAANTRPRG